VMMVVVPMMVLMMMTMMVIWAMQNHDHIADETRSTILTPRAYSW
jgi:PIN domain nuclease of toxin-antitoxin system